MSKIYREKITETIDLSSPSFLDASVKTFYNINFSLIVDVVEYFSCMHEKYFWGSA